jgi:hypothetical protein
MGEPVTVLHEYTSMFIDAWGVSAKNFSACTFIEASIRINGSDSGHLSTTFNYHLASAGNLQVTVPLTEGLKLPM